jgi:hypothetical protein
MGVDVVNATGGSSVTYATVISVFSVNFHLSSVWHQ